jgi:translation initiation factor 3 subunit F
MATGPTPLTLPVGATENSVRVHPVVLFTIVDAFSRRAAGQARVIGALLGAAADGVVDVRACYAVPHSEGGDQVAVDVLHHQTMAALQARVSARERVVGWFSTGADLAGSDALIHSFFAGECANPVHLVVDTAMAGGRLGVRALVSRSLGIKGRELAREFQEVPCEARAEEAERAGGAELLGAELAEALPTDGEGLDATLGRLQAALARAEAYVGEVAEGRRRPDAAAGRALAEVVASVPRLAPEDLAKLVDDARTDAALAAYMAGLVRAHVALADRLGTMQLPLL